MKRLTLVLILLIFLLFPFNVLADEGRFDTAHDMYYYFYAHRKYPDYFCGMWSTDGSMNNLTLSVLDSEEGEKGKQELLDWIRDDEGITFVYGKYSLNYLMQVKNEITGYLKDGTGVVTVGILDNKNVVEVGILKDSIDNEETKEVVETLQEKYGDAVSFYYTGLIYTLEDKDVIGSVVEFAPDFRTDMVEFSPKPDRASGRLWIYVGFSALVILTISAVWFVFGYRRKKVFVTAHGQTETVRPKPSVKEVELIIKNTQAEVSADLEDRIMKEIQSKQ